MRRPIPAPLRPAATAARRRFLRASAGLGSLAASGSAVLGSATLAGAPRAAFARGRDHIELDPPVKTRDPSRVEVLEFFWFGCPHCYAFEPAIDDWAASKPDYVDFVREAPPLNPSWEQHSRAFYAAEILRITDGMFDATFDRIHRDGKPLRDPARIVEFVESLDLGVDAGTFRKTMDSFAVETALRRSVGLARGANVTGVPSILINGKYLTGNSLAGSHAGIIDVIDRMAAEEHAAS